LSAETARPAISATIKIGVAIAISVWILDQFTKYLIIQWVELPRHGSIQLLPFLNLTFARNTGVAMSLFDIGSDFARWALVGVMAAIGIGVCWMLTRAERWLYVIALGLVVGGAIGNITDRIHLGYVVDFIHFHVETWSFYIFNAADSAISIGVFMIVLDQFCGFRRSEAG
jgi:signal peptidase II